MRTPFDKDGKSGKNTPLFYLLCAVVLCALVIFAILLINSHGGMKKFFGADATDTPLPGVTGVIIDDEPSDTPYETPEGTQGSSETPFNDPTATPTPTSGNNAGTPTPVPQNTPVPTVASKASILTCGDNLLHTGILNEAKSKAAAEGSGRDFSFEYIYKDVASFVSSFDLSVINQESIILPKNYLSNDLGKYLRSDGSFVTPAEMTDALLKTGFDVLDMANNHMLDMGAAGLQWSMDYLKTVNGLMTVGSYYDEKDMSDIRVAEVSGIKIAMLAYTYGTNVPEDRARQETGFKFIIPYIDDQRMISDLQKANSIADFTIVFIHWGNENEANPSAEQRRIASLLAQNGAGIIIGHHPHVLQTIESIDNGKGGKVTCVYSLGTLVSNMANQKNMLAGFFTFNIVKYSNGTAAVADEKFYPTVFYYSMDYTGSRLMYLDQLTDSLATSHGVGNYPKNSDVKNRMTRNELYNYLKATIPAKYLEDKYR